MGVELATKIGDGVTFNRVSGSAMLFEPRFAAQRAIQLLPQATSAAALARLESTPALAADPALDALRLGAALPTSSITEGTST